MKNAGAVGKLLLITRDEESARDRHGVDVGRKVLWKSMTTTMKLAVWDRYGGSTGRNVWLVLDRCPTAPAEQKHDDVEVRKEDSGEQTGELSHVDPEAQVSNGGANIPGGDVGLDEHEEYIIQAGGEDATGRNDGSGVGAEGTVVQRARSCEGVGSTKPCVEGVKAAIIDD